MASLDSDDRLQSSAVLTGQQRTEILPSSGVRRADPTTSTPLLSTICTDELLSREPEQAATIVLDTVCDTSHVVNFLLKHQSWRNYDSLYDHTFGVLTNFFRRFAPVFAQGDHFLNLDEITAFLALHDVGKFAANHRGKNLNLIDCTQHHETEALFNFLMPRLPFRGDHQRRFAHTMLMNDKLGEFFKRLGLPLDPTLVEDLSRQVRLGSLSGKQLCQRLGEASYDLKLSEEEAQILVEDTARSLCILATRMGVTPALLLKEMEAYYQCDALAYTPMARLPNKIGLAILPHLALINPSLTEEELNLPLRQLQKELYLWREDLGRYEFSPKLEPWYVELVRRVERRR